MPSKLRLGPDLPTSNGYYWFVGHVYHEGALGGTINVRWLVKVVSIEPILVSYDGMTYTEYDISGQYTGPIEPSPPWEK